MSKLTIRDEPTRRLAQERIAALILDDRAFDLTLEKHVKHRSGGQNRLQHAYYGIISNETGHTPLEIKEEMIRLFAPTVEGKISGKMRSKRTSEMTTAECSEYMERISAWAAGFAIWLPAPEEAQRHG